LKQGDASPCSVIFRLQLLQSLFFFAALQAVQNLSSRVSFGFDFPNSASIHQ
jgi:hypothetical protein